MRIQAPAEANQLILTAPYTLSKTHPGCNIIFLRLPAEVVEAVCSAVRHVPQLRRSAVCRGCCCVGGGTGCTDSIAIRPLPVPMPRGIMQYS